MNNPDYIYGTGISDSAAVASLSISIGVKVENEVKYNITEENKKVSTKFVKNSGMSYSRFLNGTNAYYENGIYYRYINKKEFINTKLSLCLKYENKAEELDNMNIKHKKNLVLGYYYKAYTMLNDELFIALTNNEYDSWKSSLMNKAKSVYLSGAYGNIFIDEKGINGYWLAINISSKTVGIPSCIYAFEYQDGGVWKTPSYYRSHKDGISKEVSIPNDNIYFDKSFVKAKSNIIIYRYLYEDEYGKINVPEEWYFSTYKAINSRNLN